VLVDRRRALDEDDTRMVSQLHQLLLELIPGGAKRDLSAAQTKKLLPTVRPRDIAGETRRRAAAVLIRDLERTYARKKGADKELAQLLAAAGTSLTILHGIGPPAPPASSSRSATSPASRQEPHRVLDPAPPSSPRPLATTSATDCPWWEPSDQPGPARHGHGPAAESHRRPRVLRPH
jgi:hypothetical protein